MAKIVYAYSSVAVLGAHYWWAKINDAGTVVGQIHGWASNNGVITPTAIGGNLVASESYVYNFSASTPYAIAIEGSNTFIEGLWKAGQLAVQQINLQGFSYNSFNSFGGFNSNAVFSTIGMAMKLAPKDISGFFTLTPGFGTVILPQAVLDAAYISGTAGGGGSGGGDDGSSGVEPSPGGGGGANPGNDPKNPGGYYIPGSVSPDEPVDKYISLPDHTFVDVELVGTSTTSNIQFDMM